MLLAVEDISMQFGGLRALDKVSFGMKSGQIFGLIGPNGSGKTTLANIISGFLKPSSGRVLFEGQEMQGKPPHVIAEAGLCRTFQITLNPRRMTVMENMLLGAARQTGENIVSAMLQSGQVAREEERNLERARDLLEMVGLQRHADELAGSLSGGQKKLLALVQVLMAEPKLILLDEPVAGVNPRLIEDIVAVILQLRRAGHNFFIIEHNMQVVRRLCDEICVLDMGNVLAQGAPEEVLAREDVLQAYIASGGVAGEGVQA